MIRGAPSLPRCGKWHGPGTAAIRSGAEAEQKAGAEGWSRRLEQIAGLPAQWLTYAQLCDASGSGPDIANRADVRLEAVDYRLLPGDGDLSLRDWLAALPAELPLSLEIRSLALRSAYPDFTRRAREVLQRTQNWLDNTKAVRTARFC